MKKKKLKDKLSKFFSPTLCTKSREIVGDIQEEALKKHDNGKTQNLDFFKALPSGASKETLTLAKDNKRMKGKAGCVDLKMKKKRKRTGKFSSPRKRKLPGKKKNLDPEYISPYTKEILQNEEIPLKIIVNDVNNYNSSRRTKSKTRTLRKSLSHSKSKKNLLDGMPLVKNKTSASKYRKKGKKRHQRTKKKDILVLENGKGWLEQLELNETNVKRRAKKLVYIDDLDAKEKGTVVKKRGLRFVSGEEKAGRRDLDDFEATDVSITKFKV